MASHLGGIRNPMAAGGTVTLWANGKVIGEGKMPDTVHKVVFDLRPVTHEDKKTLHPHARTHAVGEGAAG